MLNKEKTACIPFTPYIDKSPEKFSVKINGVNK